MGEVEFWVEGILFCLFVVGGSSWILIWFSTRSVRGRDHWEPRQERWRGDGNRVSTRSVWGRDHWEPKQGGGVAVAIKSTFGFKTFSLKWAKASFIGSRLIWLIWFWSWFDTDCFLILVYWLFYQLFGYRVEMDSKRLQKTLEFLKIFEIFFKSFKLFEVETWENF